MKTIKTLLLFLSLIAGGMINTISAQEVTVAEPDTTSADLFYIVTESNDLKALPYEMGKIKTHKNKFGKIASIVGNVASAAGVVGNLGIIASAHTESLNGLLTSMQVMNSAYSVGDLAGIANNLAGAEGQDLTFNTPHSKTVVPGTGKDLNIIAALRCKDRETAITAFKIVRFKTTKSDRRLHWLQTKASLINTEKADDANKAGYLSFGYKSYGDHSSLLTVPAAQLQKGEYGVYFLGNMFGVNQAILCYTFAIE